MVDEFSEIMNHLSENARFALQKADFYSKRYNQGYMGTEHLLMGILAQDTSTGARLLRENGVDIDQVERAQGKVAVDVPAAPMAMMSLSEATVLTLRMSLNFAKENGLDIVGTEHVGKQLFGKSILGRILLVAKSQVATAHEREPSERPGR